MLAIAKKIYSRMIWFFRRFEKSKHLWSKEKLIAGAMNGYKNNHGYEFDINAPKLFTEKIQWYKIFYEQSDMVKLVDKYLFKDYIKEKLGEGYTIPLIASWNDLKSFKKDWASLPEEFCLKSNLQSDGNFIKIIHNKSQENFKEIKKEVKKWLIEKNTLKNSFCRAYYDAKPCIIAEQYMENIDGQLYDWKVFCFNGEPFCFYVATDHFGDENHPITFYDLDWNKLDVTYGNHKTEDIAKPIHFEEMIELSRKLSDGFPFIRVDFFETDEKLYLAELTLYPGGGLTPYYPVEFNRKMGELFQIPEC